MTPFIYALGDADDVRKRLQGYLLSGDLESLGSFSAGLTEAINTIGRLAQVAMRAEVIFSGGDEILLRFEPANFSEEKLSAIRQHFEEKSGVTISFGVGLSTEDAFLNLARAKSLGRGKLVLSSGIRKGSDA